MDSRTSNPGDQSGKESRSDREQPVIANPEKQATGQKTGAVLIGWEKRHETYCAHEEEQIQSDRFTCVVLTEGNTGG